jgi:polygalacturonase
MSSNRPFVRCASRTSDRPGYIQIVPKRAVESEVPAPEIDRYDNSAACAAHPQGGHGGVTIGSEISGHCRNVFVEDCVMDSPVLDRALRFKNNAARCGVIENVYMRNCQVGQVADAVLSID